MLTITVCGLQWGAGPNSNVIKARRKALTCLSLLTPYTDGHFYDLCHTKRRLTHIAVLIHP